MAVGNGKNHISGSRRGGNSSGFDSSFIKFFTINLITFPFACNPINFSKRKEKKLVPSYGFNRFKQRILSFILHLNANHYENKYICHNN